MTCVEGRRRTEKRRAEERSGKRMINDSLKRKEGVVHVVSEDK